MTRPLVFLDTETTSLRHDRMPWDIALIHRGQAGGDQIHCLRVDVPIVDADPEALRIGGYWSDTRKPTSIAEAAETVEILTRDATIVAANPTFDLGALSNLLRAGGFPATWHYRPICVESLYLGSMGQGFAQGLRACAEELGIAERFAWHTALGDAKAVREMYDHLVARTVVAP